MSDDKTKNPPEDGRNADIDNSSPDLRQITGEKNNQEPADEENSPDVHTAGSGGYHLPLKDALAYLGLFIVFTAVLLAPVFFYQKSRVWAMLGVEDGAETIWLYWAWKLGVSDQWKVLTSQGFSLQGFGTFIMGVISFPLQFRMGNFFDFIPTRILEIFLPFPVYHNLKIIIVFILNGFCFFLLAFHLTGDRITSFLTGAMFACLPVFLLCTGFGWMEQIFLFPSVLYILYLLKAFHEKKNRWKNCILCGLFLCLTSVLYWFSGMFMILMSIIYFIHLVFSRRKDKNLFYSAVSFLLAIQVFLLFIFPFAYPYIKMIRQGEKLQGVSFLTEFPRYSEAEFQQQNIIMDACSLEYPVFEAGKRYVPSIVIISVLISIFFIKKIPIFWYLSALFFYLISLGPYLKIRGEMVEPYRRMVLYTFLYKYMPFFTRFHWPSRVQGLFALSCLVITAYVLCFVKSKLGKWRKYSNIPALLVFLLFITGVFRHNFLPVAYTPFHVPEYYMEIGKSPEKIGIVELPFSSEQIFMNNQETYGNFFAWSELKNNCYYQTFHQKKIFESYLATGQYPDEVDGTISTHTVDQLHPFIVYFCNMSRDPGAAKPLQKKDRDYFIKSGYRYLAVHKRYFKRIALYRHKWMGRPAVKITPEEAVEELYLEYLEKLIEEFGEPVAVNEEILWDGKPWVYSKEQGRVPDGGHWVWEGTAGEHRETRLQDFELEKHPVLFFNIENR